MLLYVKSNDVFTLEVMYEIQNYKVNDVKAIYDCDKVQAVLPLVPFWNVEAEFFPVAWTVVADVEVLILVGL